MTATGSKATINLDPAALSTIPIQTGTISGPVQVQIDRTETATGKAPERTLLNGEADQVELDLKPQRTITLTGNVKVRGESGLYLGTSEGDTVVIFLDESLKPIRVRVTGSPTKSTLRDKSAGGGGK
jgi:lipopolysaccharide export system protein LptA